MILRIFGYVEPSTKNIIFLATEDELIFEKNNDTWKNWQECGILQEGDVLTEDFLGKPLLDEKGCHNYKWQDGQLTETTAEEKEQEVAQKPPVLPSEENRIQALEKAVLSMMMGGAGNV